MTKASAQIKGDAPRTCGQKTNCCQASHRPAASGDTKRGILWTTGSEADEGSSGKCNKCIVQRPSEINKARFTSLLKAMAVNTVYITNGMHLRSGQPYAHVWKRHRRNCLRPVFDPACRELR